MRKYFLPPCTKPNVNRRFTDDIWPCAICGQVFTDFILVWKHIIRHRRGVNFILQDPNSLIWSVAFEKYNTFHISDFINMEKDMKDIKDITGKLIQFLQASLTLRLFFHDIL